VRYRNPPTVSSPAKRVDLHCHSKASTEADEAVLLALKCPESYSDPEEVYAQAKGRGMDFVTLTDHDTLDGVLTLTLRLDVLTGEELTCYFPEDHCKMHVLVWGITPEQHDQLQARGQDIYSCADYIESQQIAHSVAHPVYRQNDRLERWHLERLMVLFKGFECLNGAHSNLHREAFEPMLDDLTPARLAMYAEKHGLRPRWHEPHLKSRTGGSDDHGLFNIGRTWTEFPAWVQTPDEVLECLRNAQCTPGGEAGSSLKLAHNFYGVGIKYFSRSMLPAKAKPTLPTIMLQRLVGERSRFRRRDLVKMVVKSKARAIGGRIVRPFRRAKPEPTGTALLLNLFSDAFTKSVPKNDRITEALHQGIAPLGEHRPMWDLVGSMNREISKGIVDSVGRALGRGEIGAIFDSISAVAMHQFLLAPYYFALFHQNRERHLLKRITGHGRTLSAKNLKVGVFTDTFDEVNGVARFVRDISTQAHLTGRSLTVATCSDDVKLSPVNRVNFKPMASGELPYYPELKLVIPPLAEIMEWADRQQFDAIHVDTPGAMGICGWLVAKMLRVPLLGTYHTDFPAYVDNLTHDYRLTSAAQAYTTWFYGQQNVVFSRSREYQTSLRKMGVRESAMAMTPPAIDTRKFNPKHRDPKLWEKLGVKEPERLLYVGRASVEKNLALLVEAFKSVSRKRPTVALIIAGDGPFLETMKRELRGLPAYFLGYQNDQQLAPLYASSDLFVFPSRTDTLGQVIIEAQASGLPVLVSDEGGPKEVMDDGVTGQILPGTEAEVWAKAIDAMLSNLPELQRMARTAPGRMMRYSVAMTFEGFWEAHLQAALKMQEAEENVAKGTPLPEKSPFEAEASQQMTPEVAGV